jgi:hypothetical protein
MLNRWANLGVVIILSLPAAARADAFDNYVNPLLAKIPESKSAQKLAKLTHEHIGQHGRALPGITETMIVVKTNDNRWAKLLVQHGRQKINDTESTPIIIVERYVTFREGQERTIHASAKNIHLFENFRLNLDLGQIVPKDVPADLRVGVNDGFPFLETVGKAEMYVITKHLPEANPKKPEKLVVGAQFEVRYFNGSYKLFDDGRRSGTLNLKIADNGEVSGWYYSDKDGQKYEVSGKVSNSPQHRIDFLVTYPRSTQTFVGYLFTGDGRAITGTSRLQNHETGFYAVRIESAK